MLFLKGIFTCLIQLSVLIFHSRKFQRSGTTFRQICRVHCRLFCIPAQNNLSVPLTLHLCSRWHSSCRKYRRSVISIFLKKCAKSINCGDPRHYSVRGGSKKPSIHPRTFTTNMRVFHH